MKYTGSLGAALALPGNLQAKGNSSLTGIKDHFTGLAPDFIYLNSGTEGSMPDVVIDSLKQGLERWAASPTDSYETDKIFGKHQQYNRQKVADFLSVKKDNICLTDNTTMGLAMTLTGLNFKAGDRVIVTNHEHPAMMSPLTILQERTGLTVVKRDFPPPDILRNITVDELLDFLFPDRLRGAQALCVSHVYPTTGVRLPLDALRRKADALDIRYLVVDGAQAFGMVDTSRGNDHIAHADFYACPGHKWLNGPPSTGILYIKNAAIKPPEFYPVLSQRMGKYLSPPAAFPMVEALQVRGCSNAPGFSAMLGAIEFERGLGGASFVEQHILMLSQQVRDFIIARAPGAMVSPFRAPELLSGLTVFFPFSWHNPEKIYSDKQTADRIVKVLLKKNIQIRSIGFENPADKGQDIYVLRVSTGIFNSSGQIDQFKRALKDALSRI